jgi:hypothetical protein
MRGKHAPAWVDEQLSAYLDGALSPADQARLEALLATDPDLHERLEGLQRTVALIQALPRVQAPRNFLLTPAMVAPPRTRPSPRRWLAPALTFATAASAFLCVMLLAGGLFTSGLASQRAMAPGAAEPAFEVAMEEAEEEAALETERDAVVEEAEALASPIEAPLEPGQDEAPAPLPAETEERVAVEAQPEEEEGVPPPAALEAVTATVEMSATLSPEQAVGGGGPAPTETSTPSPALSWPAPTPPMLAAPEPSPAPPMLQEEQDLLTPTPAPETSRIGRIPLWTVWPAVGGLALLTVGLAVATALAWRARRR